MTPPNASTLSIHPRGCKWAGLRLPDFPADSAGPAIPAVSLGSGFTQPGRLRSPRLSAVGAVCLYLRLARRRCLKSLGGGHSILTASPERNEISVFPSSRGQEFLGHFRGCCTFLPTDLLRPIMDEAFISTTQARKEEAPGGGSRGFLLRRASVTVISTDSSFSDFPVHHLLEDWAEVSGERLGALDV